MRCAVIGSTGYLGTRLVPRLLARGDEVTVLVRSPEKLALTGWADEVDVVAGSLEEPEALAHLTAGADVVVHLAHALDRPDFPDRDRAAAHAVADAAHAAGVGRIVYLGGLRPPPDEGESSVPRYEGRAPLRSVSRSVSRHLASRAEVADVFLASPVPTAALEASIVVGSGSASFEMIRYLAERVLVLPGIPWLAHRTQPIAIDDVLHYLVAAMLLGPEVDRRFDVGGPDVLTYLDLVQRYARLAGLPQRVAVPVPLPVPPGGATVAAIAMELLSPLPRRLVEPLIESLRHELVCDRDSLADARRLLGDPPGGPTTYGAAVRAALGRPRDGTDASGGDPTPVAGQTGRPAALALPSDPVGSGGATWRWSTTAHGSADLAAVWEAVTRIGGDTGWYAPPGVFAALGWADQLLGGVGGYRGRPHGRALVIGDVIDGWRVEGVSTDGPRRLRLRADLKVPGRLWLTFTVAADDTTDTGGTPGTALTLEVSFAPSGLAGVAYGAALRVGAPLVFGPMARGALRAGEQKTGSSAH